MATPKGGEPPSWYETGFVVLAWFVLNISIGNITKWTYLYGQICKEDGVCKGYRYPLTMTVVHMIFSWTLCLIYLKCIKGQDKFLTFEKQVKKVVPLALCFSVSVAFGNMSLKYIFPSFNQMLGAMAPIITVIMSMGLLGKRYNLWTWISMPVICGGLILCSAEELNFEWHGAVFCLGATILRSLKSIIQGKLLVDPSEKMDSVTLLFYMAPYAGFFLLIGAIAIEGTEPLTIFFTGRPQGVPKVLLLLGLGGLNACLLNIANFLVTAYTSAVTLQVLGNVKSCLSIAVSIVIFRNAFKVEQGVGIAICMFGVWVYDKKGGTRQVSAGYQTVKEPNAGAVEPEKVGAPSS